MTFRVIDVDLQGVADESGETATFLICDVLRTVAEVVVEEQVEAGTVVVHGVSWGR
jgi:hypothetical protein